jgi:hypothetical protein
MYMYVCGVKELFNSPIRKKIRSANRKSVTCHICGRSVNFYLRTVFLGYIYMLLSYFVTFMTVAQYSPPNFIELAPDGLQLSELCPSCPYKPY